MNSLLKRQIRKYLTDENITSKKDLEPFLDSINRSYTNFDEQFAMQQRAMTISSEELFIANQNLLKEAEAQKEVIDKLKHVIETLKFYELPEQSTDNLDGLKLVDFIDNQTKEIVKINKQRETLLEELASQNQELGDYAHMVSHDLKSPLRNIDALTTWIKDDYSDKLDDNGKENLKLIRANVEKMDALINGILDYSTIGKSQVDLYEVNIDALVDDILNIIHVPKHISIIKKDSLPVIKGDKYKFQQLFQNLIVNAVNYNDKSKGVIEISVKNQEDVWQFSIKDNGKGIDNAYFDKIFETFQTLEGNQKSTGIGLSIVKKIIDIQKGKIWLESEVGIGSNFFFTIKK